MQQQLTRVDGDRVTLLNEGDGATDGGFRRHVAYHHTPGAAGKPAVGNQTDRFTQTLTDQRPRGCQHFRHAGSALGAKVAQHHDVPWNDLSRQDGCQAGLFVVKHAGRSSHHGVLQASNLGNAAFRRQITLQYGQMALLVHRVGQRADHVLVGAGKGRDILQYFGDGLASDRDAVAMQQTRRQQDLHDLGNAAGAVQVNRQVLAAGLEIAQDGRLLAHSFEVVNRPVHASRMGNGQEVQHRIGRATGGHDHGDGIFNRLAGHDIARLEVLLDGLDQYGG